MRPLQTIRRGLGRVRDHVDGLLHRRRLSRARERLRRQKPETILVLCLGNVCRSPYARWAIEAKARGGLTVDSAGFIGPDRSPPEIAVRAAQERGIDHSSHRSKLVSVDMVNRADAVLVFDRRNVRRLRRTSGARLDHVYQLGDFDPVWTGRRAILDPWGKPEEVFRETFQRIDRCVDSLLGIVAEQ